MGPTKKAFALKRLTCPSNGLIGTREQAMSAFAHTYIPDCIPRGFRLKCCWMSPTKRGPVVPIPYSPAQPLMKPSRRCAVVYKLLPCAYIAFYGHISGTVNPCYNEISLYSAFHSQRGSE